VTAERGQVGLSATQIRSATWHPIRDPADDQPGSVEIRRVKEC
jgi:hypothetical protein